MAGLVEGGRRGEEGGLLRVPSSYQPRDHCISGPPEGVLISQDQQDRVLHLPDVLRGTVPAQIVARAGLAGAVCLGP